MITRHFFKYRTDDYNTLISIDLIKSIRDDSDELIAEIQVPPNEFALALSEEEISSLLVEARDQIFLEISRLTSYDPASTLPTKGLSSPPSGAIIGRLVSTILEVGAYSASRPTE